MYNNKLAWEKRLWSTNTTRTLVPWRQEFRHSTRNKRMGWFTQIHKFVGTWSQNMLDHTWKCTFTSGSSNASEVYVAPATSDVHINLNNGISAQLRKPCQNKNLQNERKKFAPNLFRSSPRTCARYIANIVDANQHFCCNTARSRTE